MDFDYEFVDIDNHYYEPDDCFSRHIDPKFAGHAVNIRRGEDGIGRVYLGGRRLGFQSVTQTDWIGAPGSLRDYFAGLVEKSDSGEDAEGPVGKIGDMADVIKPREIPAFMNRDARLKLMDSQNIQACLMLPTLGVCVEAELSSDPPAALANVQAFNRWLEGDWGYNHHERIFSAPLISLVDLDAALIELERVLDLGARVVLIRVGPVNGRSPGDPYFDPFWQRVVDAGIPVGLHVGDSGFCELFSTAWGERARPPVQQYSAFQVYSCFMERPIAETVAALVLHNLFGRFPSLRIISIENGSSWVAPLLKQMDKAWRAARGREGVGGVVTERPSDTFRQHVYVSPFPEDDLTELTALIGVERVVLGSDFPHPEGLVHPAEFADELKGLDDSDIRSVMRGNGATLLGLAP